MCLEGKMLMRPSVCCQADFKKKRERLVRRDASDFSVPGTTLLTMSSSKCRRDLRLLRRSSEMIAHRAASASVEKFQLNMRRGSLKVVDELEKV